MKFFNKTRIVLIAVLGLALIMRVYRIGADPIGFFCDEAVRGLDAYYLLTRGVDSNNAKFPIFFRALGEYTPPIQTYSEMLSVAVLGLNEIAVRLPAAIFGTISIVLVYLLAKTLFSRRVGLIAAIIMALTPWAIHYSRTGFEYNIYLVFFLLSLWTWARGRENQRWFLISAAFWGLTLYTYNPAKLIVPIFFLMLIIWDLKSLIKKPMVVVSCLLIFTVISIPMGWHIKSGKGLIRFNQVSVFNGQADSSAVIQRMATNYARHYSLDFLFFRGEPDLPSRHFSTVIKPLLIVTLPFWLLGIRRLLLRKKRIVWLWVAIYPLSGVLISDIGTYRAMIGLPLMVIITAIGIDWVVARVPKWSSVVL